MSSEALQKFKEGISKLCWERDFSTFCKLLGWDIDNKHAQDSWFALQKLNEGLQAIAVSDLLKLLGG